MISGIGIDIIEIERIKESYTKHGEKFLTRLFTPAEQAYFKTFNDPLPIIAGRWAAKEAIAKALGSGFGEKLYFTEIEIINNKAGKPEVTLSPRCQAIFDDPSILLSISHCNSHATATALTQIKKIQTTC